MIVKRVLAINTFLAEGTFNKVETFFKDVLGAKIGPEMTWLTDKYGHRAKMVQIGTIEPMGIELAECADENLVIGKQIKKFAPCFSAITLQVDSVDNAIAELRAMGIKVSDKLVMTSDGWETNGIKDEHYECMIHPKNFGLLIELLEFDKAPSFMLDPRRKHKK